MIHKYATARSSHSKQQSSTQSVRRTQLNQKSSHNFRIKKWLIIIGTLSVVAGLVYVFLGSYWSLFTQNSEFNSVFIISEKDSFNKKIMFAHSKPVTAELELAVIPESLVSSVDEVSPKTLTFVLGRLVDRVETVSGSESLETKMGLVAHEFSSLRNDWADGEQWGRALSILSTPSHQVRLVEVTSEQAWRQYSQAQASRVEIGACDVAIVNSTTVPGAAQSVSQVLERSGAIVVRLTNSQDDVEQTAIYTQNQIDCDQTVARLRHILELEAAAKDAELPALYRADIVVVVGRDVADLIERSRRE